MDDGSPIGYILLIVFFILGGAYFAASETSLASVNRIRMMSNAGSGDRRAKRVLYILDHFDKAITTILIGTNIMHIGCASVATLMATKLWGVSSVGATTIVVTLIVFFFAEMLPKRFSKAANEVIAPLIAGSLVFLMRVLSPVSFVFTRLSALISGPFKKAVPEEPTVTEDELYDMIETFAQEGAADEEKTELVQSALEFSDTTVRDVLTPWKSVLTVDASMDAEAILACIRDNSHSRLPVVDEYGNVTGLLHIRKYLKAYMRNAGNVALADVTDRALTVGPDVQIDDLLPVLSANKTQIAVVTGEAGAPLGIITVEDILEELVGEIYDEDDVGETAGKEAAAL